MLKPRIRINMTHEFNASSEIKIEGVNVEGRLDDVNVAKVISVSLPGLSVLYVVSLD